MGSYILSCCSTVDLSREHLESRSIPFIGFHYRLGGQEYQDDLNTDMTWFYENLAKDVSAETSQPNISEYLNFFDPFLKQGLDILHISFSGGLSGAWNSAVNAALIAAERYPERRIQVIDSLCASSGYGLFVDHLADLRDRGMDLSTLAEHASRLRLSVQHLFVSTDLGRYVAGGRISKTAALFGGVLKICPFLDMNGEGKLVSREKHRGKKMAMRRMVERMKELAEDGTSYSGKCYISHSACLSDAEELAEAVEEQFPNLKGPVEIHDVGTTIGCHTGNGTVALFFFGRDRE